MTGNAKVILTADTYNLCHVRMSGQSTLIVPATNPISRLFVDDPQGCSGVANAGTITMDGTSRIVNCHLSTDPGSFQLYALGSATASTTQTLAGGAPLSAAVMPTVCGAALPAGGTPMVLYAPRSTVVLRGSTALTGQVAGDVVRMNDMAAVQPVDNAINLNALGAGPVLPLYQPLDYVECSSVSLAEVLGNPTQGC
jgi:hypothetical protein